MTPKNKSGPFSNIVEDGPRLLIILRWFCLYPFISLGREKKIENQLGVYLFLSESELTGFTDCWWCDRLFDVMVGLSF